MARNTKSVSSNSKSRPITEGLTNRGGVNTNPSAALSRPAQPQPYKATGSKISGKE